MLFVKIFDKKPPARPEEPATSLGLSDQIWNILEECWGFEPRERPDISVVLRRLQELTPTEQSQSTSAQTYLNVLQPLNILVSGEADTLCIA